MRKLVFEAGFLVLAIAENSRQLMCYTLTNALCRVLLVPSEVLSEEGLGAPLLEGPAMRKGLALTVGL